jgi:hypothetical protein
MTTTPNHAKQRPYCQADEDFCHLLTCSHPVALKTRYDSSESLRKAIKSHLAGPSLMNAIRWTHVLTLRGNTSTCLSEKSCLDLSEIDNDGFSLPACGCSSCQLSWHGTTNSLHLLSIETLLLPSPFNVTTNAGYVTYSPDSFHSDRSSFPNIFHRSLRNRHYSLSCVTFLNHPSDAISQITHARPCGMGLQHYMH